ncbi:MAG: c-type cytochrome [Saprospirales bacterium]|nr:c-type cytochrome [Saprospirales bacterium]
MNKGLKIVGFILGGILTIILAVAAWIQFSSLPTFEVVPPVVELPVDSLSLAQGQKIVTTVCAHCHLGEDGKMSGRLFSQATDPFGEMYSANITQHPAKGIGRYTDGEIAYLVRTGVNRDGRMTGYMMCHPGMSDKDLASVIAYMRSDAGIMQPSEAAHPLPAYLDMFIVKALIKFGVFNPLPYDGQPILAPDPNDLVAYGKYLSTQVYECYGCHSASFETADPLIPEKSPNYCGCGNLITDEDFVETLSRNITPDKTHGIGNWTQEQFHAAVKMGVRPDGSMLKIQMPRFAALDDQEIAAIWAYLQTVPAIGTDPFAIAEK